VKVIYDSHAASLAPTAYAEPDLAQPATTLDQHAALRIGGDHVDRAVAFLVRHPSLGPRDEGRSLDDGDDRSHGA
jgi:hypothetical protein